jgi:hypothetical protein
MKSVGGCIARTSMLVAAIALFGLTSSKAATVTWNFGTGVASPGADLGASAIINSSTSPTYQLTAAGFTSYSGGVFGSSVHVFNKNDGGEQGLGLTTDPSGNNEIWGSSVLRIDFSAARSAGLTGFTLQMDSSTINEGWQLFGTNTGLTATDYALIASGSGTNQLTDFIVTGAAAQDKYYFIRYNGDTTGANGSNDNVLLHSISAVSPVPLPGALPLFASGLGALGLLGWRRKRKATAIAA